jgi:hypothetical protein
VARLTDAWGANEQWGCDTCGRIYWRITDCPVLSTRKKGLIIGFREKIYVNKCLSCLN